MKIPEMKRWQCVVVEWVDSCGSEAGWRHTKRKSALPSQCVTAGLVFDQKPKHLTIVLSRDRLTKSVCGAITIPTVAITKLTKLGAVE